MTREEAEAFVVEAAALAMARDASSGGVIRTVTLDKDGPKFRWVLIKALQLQAAHHPACWCRQAGLLPRSRSG